MNHVLLLQIDNCQEGIVDKTVVGVVSRLWTLGKPVATLEDAVSLSQNLAFNLLVVVVQLHFCCVVQCAQ